MHWYASFLSNTETGNAECFGQQKVKTDVLVLMKPFGKLFQVLECNSKPTITSAVLTYCKEVNLLRSVPATGR